MHLSLCGIQLLFVAQKKPGHEGDKLSSDIKQLKGEIIQ